MSKLQHTVLLLGTGVVVGGLIGAYGMTLVYGDRPTERIAPSERCPIAEACEPCPPPPACDTQVPMVEPTDEDPPTFEPPSAERPGLPASAISLASKTLREAAGPCLEAASEVSGSFILDLTVTATSGVGRLVEIEVGASDGDVKDVIDCVVAACEAVRFEWSGADGSSKLRVPLELSPSESELP